MRRINPGTWEPSSWLMNLNLEVKGDFVWEYKCHFMVQDIRSAPYYSNGMEFAPQPANPAPD